MQVEEHAVEILYPKILSDAAICRRVEKIARTCYRSHNKMKEDSYKTFIPMLIERGHMSVFEHISLSVSFKTSRAVADELRTHRIGAFAMSSTRYIDFKDTPKIVLQKATYSEEDLEIGIQGAKQSWATYCMLREKGVSPQMARNFLPLCLATELVYTTNVRQWIHVLKLRTHSSCHPEMIHIMTKLKTELLEAIPTIFTNIDYWEVENEPKESHNRFQKDSENEGV